MNFFDGDGGKLVAPVNVPRGTIPKSVKASLARMLVKNFLISGRAFSSSTGATLWVPVHYCVTENIPHRVVQLKNAEGKCYGWLVESVNN